jgi:mono/diheme cytochrome c family protein
MLESLWIHQAHGRIDLDLLDRVATRPEPLVRAGAIRVLRHWLQQEEVEMSAALPLLERAVDDEDMRVRLEGVVACGFIPDVAGASVASLAAERDMDDGIRIALEATLEHLSRYGEPQSGIARRLRLERTPAAELAAMPLDDMVAQVTLLRSDVPETQRVDALAFLAGDKGADRVSRLLDELIGARDRKAAAEAIGPVLLAMPKPALARSEAKLKESAGADDGIVRSLSVAAMIAVDPARSDLVGDDGGLAVAVLEHLPPGAAPADTVATLRSAVEAGSVDSGAAVAQVARHASDTGALFDWLGGLVEPADRRGLGDFDDAHVTAMAALRAMNTMPAGEWPEGYEAFRVPAADPALLERGRSVYLDEINGCSRCHGVNGTGEEGFPPLARSPWVLGDPERAAGIVVHGLSGRIEIPDGRTFESAMAPLGENLGDEQIAAVLTFVRQSWGNYAPAVTTADVARARRLEPRGAMWDAAALEKLYPAYRDRIIAVSEEALQARRGRPFVTFLYALGVLLVPVVVVLGIILGADLALRRGSS